MKALGGSLLLACCLAGCLLGKAPSPSGTSGINWQPDAALNRGLPAGILVYRATGGDLCAVAAVLDAPAPWRAAWLERQVLTPLAFAQGRALTPALVVNGGYFDARSSLSLVVEDGVQRAPGVRELLRAGQVQRPMRAALGRMADGRSEIRAVHADELPQAWNPVWAMGGGPVLVAGGRKRVMAREEWFDEGSGVSPDAPAPRTAVALLPKGRIVFLVVDGRSPHSRGVSLDELADMLLGLGAVEAMNLDGGGSSAMVVNGVVANHPSDRAGLRPVRSVLWVRD